MRLHQLGLAALLGVAAFGPQAASAAAIAPGDHLTAGAPLQLAQLYIGRGYSSDDDIDDRRDEWRRRRWREERWRREHAEREGWRRQRGYQHRDWDDD